MCEDLLLIKTFDVIAKKDALFLSLEREGDIMYCFANTESVGRDDYHSFRDFIFHFLYHNEPFVLNVTMDQYERLNVYDEILLLDDGFFNDVFIIDDPFNEDRLFITFFGVGFYEDYYEDPCKDEMLYDYLIDSITFLQIDDCEYLDEYGCYDLLDDYIYLEMNNYD